MHTYTLLVQTVALFTILFSAVLAPNPILLALFPSIVQLYLTPALVQFLSLFQEPYSRPSPIPSLTHSSSPIPSLTHSPSPIPGLTHSPILSTLALFPGWLAYLTVLRTIQDRVLEVACQTRIQPVGGAGVVAADIKQRTNQVTVMQRAELLCRHIIC